MDRVLFIAHEISCMMVDDFMNLPTKPVFRNVAEPLSVAYWRHVDFFSYTH